MATLSVFWRRHRVLKSGTFLSRPASRNKLSTVRPLPNGRLAKWHAEQHPHRVTNLNCVRRESSPPDCFLTFLTAELALATRPRLPVAGASHSISEASRIDKEARRFSAVLHEGQFLVLFFVGDQLLMHNCYPAGFKQGIPRRICAAKPSIPLS